MTDEQAAVLEVVRRRVGGEPKLADELVMVGVDSLAMAEIAAEIEERFGVRMDDRVLDCQTLDELASYVRELRSTESR